MTRVENITIFNTYTFSDFKNLFNAYKDFFKNGYTTDLSERVDSSIIYPEKKDSIIVFEIRCNDQISFNNEIRNNDLLFVIEIADDQQGIVLHQFDCTTDPCSPKYNIAHTARQIYRGNVGDHHAIEERKCIRSDNGQGTWVRRTDGNGEVLPLNPKHSDAVLGHYGINIHDNGGFANSSMGCTILAGPDFQHHGPYLDEYKPLLLKAANKGNIPVILFDLEDVEDVINTITPPEVPGDAHTAIPGN